MKTIKEITKNEITIKKSKFITLLFPISSKKDVDFYLENSKKEYKGATHYCYAYKLKGEEKCSDDGEPSKTAGFPMLNILKNEEFDSILVIVIRFFGGIKLGASGLIHAYQDSVKEAIKCSNIINVTEGYLVQINFPYDQKKNIDYILKDIHIIYKSYDEQVIYQFEIEKEKLEDLKKYLGNINIVREIYTEKK